MYISSLLLSIFVVDAMLQRENGEGIFFLYASDKAYQPSDCLTLSLQPLILTHRLISRDRSSGLSWASPFTVNSGLTCIIDFIYLLGGLLRLIIYIVFKLNLVHKVMSMLVL